jgi:hypothetical protein
LATSVETVCTTVGQNNNIYLVQNSKNVHTGYKRSLTFYRTELCERPRVFCRASVYTVAGTVLHQIVLDASCGHIACIPQKCLFIIFLAITEHRELKTSPNKVPNTTQINQPVLDDRGVEGSDRPRAGS